MERVENWQPRLSTFTFATLQLKRFQRFTRRGEFFFDAPKGDGTGDGGAASSAAEAAKASPVTDIDYKAKLLALLGLDDTADEATIDTKISEVKTATTTLPEVQATAADSTSKLEAANTELQRVQGEYQKLFEQQQAAEKAKKEAEADAILEQYADRLTDEKAKARIRSILLSDTEAGMEILNGLPQPVAAPAGEEKKNPPAPVHDPKAATTEMTAEEKISKQNELIRTIQAEGKFKDYDSARAEARRRDATLFS